jgi:glycosyltransferase involved in cell wall biosynthesis
MADPRDVGAVTVVIPTRDRPDLVRRSLHSVLAQKGPRVDAVVVDDGSAVETARALDRLAGDRVRVAHHAQSLGVSRARNAGLALVTTPWVAFLDDDDYWAPDKLRSQLEALDDSPGADWSCTGAVHVDQHLQPLYWDEPPAPGEALEVLSRTGGIPGGGSGVLVSTSTARRVGGFDPAFSILADWDFYYRLGLASPVAPVNRPLVGYYRHPDSMFHDPRRLGRELLALDHKYSNGPAPLRLDYASWGAQLLLMAVRSRDIHLVARILGSDVVGRARKLSLMRAARERVHRGLADGRRDCPPGWADEPLGWLHDDGWKVSWPAPAQS